MLGPPDDQHGVRGGMEEKRRLHRLGVSIPCRFQGPRSTHDGMISNVSGDGAFIRADLTPHPGALLRVSFDTESGSRIEADTQVVHRGFFEDTDTIVEGFGVKFLALHGESRRLLDEFLLSLSTS